MSNFIIYHNPRCSKSRQTLKLLQDKNKKPKIILYLENTPTHEELVLLLRKLEMTPRNLLRKGEKEYKNYNLQDSSITDSEVINIMTKCPKLIERPIVVRGNKAIIGRPPENINELI